MEFREKGAEPKDAKPGIPKIKVIPGDKGAVYEVVVIVEDQLLLRINRPEGLFVEVISLECLE